MLSTPFWKESGFALILTDISGEYLDMYCFRLFAWVLCPDLTSIGTGAPLISWINSISELFSVQQYRWVFPTCLAPCRIKGRRFVLDFHRFKSLILSLFMRKKLYKLLIFVNDFILIFNKKYYYFLLNIRIIHMTN